MKLGGASRLLFSGLLLAFAWCGRAQMAPMGGWPSVSVDLFSAEVSNGVVRVVWLTADEYRLLGFLLERQSGGDWLPVTVAPVLSEWARCDRARYEVGDPAAPVGGTVTYRLTALGESAGARLELGRTTLGLPLVKSPAAVPLAPPAATMDVKQRPPPPEQLARLATQAAERALLPPVQPFGGGAAPEACYIGVRTDGVYRVTAGAIASVMGCATDDVRNAIATTNMALRLLDQSDVAWTADANDDGLLFYGQAGSSAYTIEQVYWLRFAPGLRLVETNHAADADALAGQWNEATNRFFLSTARFEETRLSTAGFETLAPEFEGIHDFMLADWVVQGATRNWNYALPDYLPAATATTVRISFRSFDREHLTDDHAIRFSLGALTLGETNWIGKQRFLESYLLPDTISGTATLTGVNLIPVNPSYISGRVGLDWFSFDYPRRFRAVANSLLCDAGTNAVILVSEFGSATVEAWDLSEPLQPIRRRALPVQAQGGGKWQAGFVPPTATNRHLVLTAAAWRSPAVMRAIQPPGLADATNAADWVVIVPPRNLANFHWAANQLAAFRAAQGLRTRVVAAEEIYDEFAHGLASPYAIRAFLLATATWSARPRYALLFGMGTADYRHELTAYLTSLLPPLLTGVTDFGYGYQESAAGDARFADDDDDGVPEIAIGRLPVSTSNDCVVVLDKLRRYEGVQAFKTNVVCTADLPTFNVPDGVNLHTSVNLSASAATAAGLNVIKHYRASASDVLRLTVAGTLQQGASLFYFLGHGANKSMGNSPDSYGSIMDTFQMTSGKPQRWPWQPIGISMSCVNNRFHIPSSGGYCMGEQGLDWAGTGFAALYASTTFMDVYDAEATGETFFHTMYEPPRRLRLGDVVRVTLQRVLAGGVKKPALLPMQALLGDPATIVRHDITAWGTDTAWLASHGLTNANDDVLDVDRDGYRAWQEYLAGSNPRLATSVPLLRIGAAQIDPEIAAMAITFESVAGLRYHIAAVEALPPAGAWEPVAHALPGGAWQPAGTPILADDVITTVWVPTGPSPRFYRVTLGD